MDLIFINDSKYNMLKYLKYYVPAFTGILTILVFLRGSYYPTLFLITFSLFVIIGDLIFPRDKNKQQFTYHSILDFSIYVNLPILFTLIFLVVSFFSNNLSDWYINGMNSIFNVNFIQIKNSFNTIDKISLIVQTTLSIGMLGIVPAHELTHRKKNTFDMFIGNWLLAFSWDCTFAIEHVYGHHKNVCLPEDPASAKRGENIYLFILRAILNEQRDGWKIERNRLKRKDLNLFSFHNRMIVGYLRNLIITILTFIFGGANGMLCFLLCALLAKSFLEAINYIEHYGLVRERGEPVCMRHSWNSNHLLSSLYLCNVTRHSDHHRATNLRFWELKPQDKTSPILPYGYLTMLYLVLIVPFLYKKIMAKKLIDWDLNYANSVEKKLANT